MSNSLVTKPIVVDTDIASFRNSAAVQALGRTQGIRVTKLVLAVGTGAASVAGNVTITAPSDGAVLYPPLPVSASTSAGTVLFVDDPSDPKSVLTWRDFAVTGVTATKTVLYIWFEV